tara:strand:- start:320 stop:1207 length:888 start_codon:yes stop_codon:yes gene_type:complete
MGFTLKSGNKPEFKNIGSKTPFYHKWHEKNSPFFSDKEEKEDRGVEREDENVETKNDGEEKVKEQESVYDPNYEDDSPNYENPWVLDDSGEPKLDDSGEPVLREDREPTLGPDGEPINSKSAERGVEANADDSVPEYLNPNQGDRSEDTYSVPTEQEIEERSELEKEGDEMHAEKIKEETIAAQEDATAEQVHKNIAERGAKKVAKHVAVQATPRAVKTQAAKQLLKQGGKFLGKQLIKSSARALMGPVGWAWMAYDAGKFLKENIYDNRQALINNAQRNSMANANLNNELRRKV